jgi:hypothetical protein
MSNFRPASPAMKLEIALSKYLAAAIIVALLAFNAALGFFQEGRAQATLAALKSRLALNVSVRRDGAWKTVQAAELVPGDVARHPGRSRGAAGSGGRASKAHAREGGPGMIRARFGQ